MKFTVKNLTLAEGVNPDEVTGTLTFTLQSKGIALSPTPTAPGSLKDAQIQLKLNTNIKTGVPKAYMTGSDSSDLVLNLPVKVLGDKRDLSTFRQAKKAAKKKS
ncbi:MAG: hypothetical protein ABW007_18795 [Chitinophagaceae bacterium]